jgi:hypothetical protein
MQNYEQISIVKVSKFGRYFFAVSVSNLQSLLYFFYLYFRLYYTNYGLLGALSTSRMNIYNANYRCYFVDETEIITEINVPYHCIER